MLIQGLRRARQRSRGFSLVLTVLSLPLLALGGLGLIVMFVLALLVKVLASWFFYGWRKCERCGERSLNVASLGIADFAGLIGLRSGKALF